MVWSEQGLGDAIQFCRYLNLLDAAGIPFIFLTRPSLMTLMRDWMGLGERVQSLESTDPKSDTRPHVALMSLPRLVWYGASTRFPSICPYLKPPVQPQRAIACGLPTWRDFRWHCLGVQSRQQGHVSQQEFASGSLDAFV